MRRRHLVLTLLACCLPAAALAGGIRYRFTSFDVPGSTSTVGDGVNRAGTIAGWFPNGIQHGYLLSAGTYTSIDYPNAAGTELYGLNDLDEITGQSQDAAGHTHGFYAVPQ